MNHRFALIDSKLSLDRWGDYGELLGMIAQQFHIYVERTDPSKNMARYYAMHISYSLFGEPCLTREWGRIGTSGQVKLPHFEREADAVRMFLNLT
ncbi:WGR domain-containing protein [Brucella sp. LJL56]